MPDTLTGPQGAVMRQLSDSGDMGALELVKGSDSVLGGGSIYTLLRRMVSKGLVRSQYMGRAETGGQIRRRVFCITDLGTQALAESPHE